MKFIKLTLAFGIAICVALPSQLLMADLVVFNLINNVDGNTFDFNAPTGSVTVNGLQADFSAVVAGNVGDLNAQSTSFGINAENIDPNTPNDNTGQLDADQGAESVVIAFSGAVSATLTAIAVSSFGGSDTGTVDIGGVTTSIDSGSTTVIPAHSELVGQTLTIAFVQDADGDFGTGFSVDSLTFHIKDAAVVPEPTSVALLGLAGLGFAARRRR